MARRDPLDPGLKKKRAPRTRTTADAAEKIPPFEGFPEGGMAFFRTLAKKQDREWFAAHKAEYEAYWHAPMQSLLAGLKESLGDAYPLVADARPKVFRIHRDTRFSQDKTPYKTNCAGSLSLSGGDAMTGTGLYVQLGLDGEFLAAGRWMLERDALDAYRAGIGGDDGVGLAKQLDAVRKKGFELTSHEALKRVPAPYDADHPRAELLRQKGFALRFPAIPAGLVHTPKFLPWVTKQATSIAPLLEWLDEHVV